MLFKEFFGLSQIWTISDSNNRIKWVENDIHVTKSSVRPYSGNEKKFRTSCSKNTTTNVWSFGFQILKKANDVWTSWDLSRSHDTIRGGYGKKIEEVSHNMSCTMFTNRSISEEESYHWEGFGKIGCQSNDRIRVWLQNFLYRQ